MGVSAVMFASLTSGPIRFPETDVPIAPNVERFSSYPLSGGESHTEMILPENGAGEGLQEYLQKTREIAEKMNVRDLRFDYIEDLGQLKVDIVDLRSNRVVRSMPPEEVIEVRRSLRRYIGERLDVTA